MSALLNSNIANAVTLIDVLKNSTTKEYNAYECIVEEAAKELKGARELCDSEHLDANHPVRAVLQELAAHLVEVVTEFRKRRKEEEANLTALPESKTRAIQLCMKMHKKFLNNANQMLNLVEMIKVLTPQNVDYDDAYFERPWCCDGDGRAAIEDDHTMIACDEALSELEREYITHPE
jgi:hypothetical protein